MKQNSPIIRAASWLAGLLYRLTGRIEVVGVVISAALWVDRKINGQ
jgi:hypothetical protein